VFFAEETMSETTPASQPPAPARRPRAMFIGILLLTAAVTVGITYLLMTIFTHKQEE
jgi:hypothetical protein